eukprot:2291297-Lingulodinium_polyedra.AAC.1
MPAAWPGGPGAPGAPHPADGRSKRRRLRAGSAWCAFGRSGSWAPECRVLGAAPLPAGPRLEMLT